MQQIRAALAFVVLLIVITVTYSEGQICDRLRSSSSTEKVSYLENYPKENFGQECVAFAIKGLGYQSRDKRAARVLVRYLGYYWKEPGCEMVSGGRCWRSPYPASASLAELGDTARPFVLEAIKSDSSSQLVRENALEVYYSFTRGDIAEAIAALRWEADMASNPKVKEHFLWAATALSKKWCPYYKDKDRCEVALSGRLPFDKVQNSYSVYDLVIPQEMPQWRSDNYAIQKETLNKGWDESAEQVRTCLGAPLGEEAEFVSAVSDFFERNQHPEQLEQKMRLPKKPYVLLDDDRVSSYRETLNLKVASGEFAVPDAMFYGMGPLLSLSRVGFSKNKEIALVYVQHETASMSGGEFHVLRRHANYWTEEQQRCEREFQKPLPEVKSFVTFPITLRVENKSGTPLSGASIDLQPWIGSSDPGKFSISQKASLTTNDKGLITINLVPGAYDLTISKPSFLSQVSIFMIEQGSYERGGIVQLKPKTPDTEEDSP